MGIPALYTTHGPCNEPLLEDFTMLNRFPLILLACASVMACGGDASSPADPAAASLRLDSLSEIVGAGTAAAGVAGDCAVFARMGEIMGLGTETVPPAANANPTAGDFGEELECFLVEEVFTTSNYEGGGVYLIPGTLLCDELDPDCIAQIDDVEIRVHAEVVGDDGLDVQILIGPARHELIGFELRAVSLAVVVNLSSAANAISYVAESQGETLELPDTVTGVIAASLTMDGPEAATLAFSIREAVTIEGQLPDSGGSFHYSSAASDPLFSVYGDAVAQTFGVSLDVGATSFGLPYSFVSDWSESMELLQFDLAGLSGAIELSEGDSTLDITDIALGTGTTTLTLGGDTLLSILFNDELGPLNLLVSAVDPDAPTFAFDPGAVLSIGTHFAPLVDEGEDIPEYFLDETYGIELTGSEPALSAVAATDVSDEAIMVTGGTLVLSIDSDAAATVTVDDGECLIGNELPEPGAHPILGEIASGPCP